MTTYEVSITGYQTQCFVFSKYPSQAKTEKILKQYVRGARSIARNMEQHIAEKYYVFTTTSFVCAKTCALSLFRLGYTISIHLTNEVDF